MMTPQMLITIPQAATFGPQNRSDGMSVIRLIDQSEKTKIFDVKFTRNVPSTDPEPSVS